MEFKITEEDIKGLLKAIRYMIKVLKKRDIEAALWVLGKLEKNLSRNLETEKVEERNVA